jgi:tRNA(Ile)-lysidine synthase
MLSMSAVKDALALRLRVVTIDHGLRPDARREIEHVRNLCVRFGLPFTAVKVDTRRRASLDGVGIEEAARIERLNALEDQLWASGAEWIALGHSRSDQAETVLLRLERGVGLDGLGCMRPRRGHFIRPLLRASRVELRDVLVDQGLRWLDDPMNEDRGFDRVRIRQDLCPVIDEERLAGIAADAWEVRAALDTRERAWLASSCHVSPGATYIDLHGLRGYDDAVQARLLRAAVSTDDRGRRALWRGATDDLVALARGERGQELTAHRLRARRLPGSAAHLLLERDRRAPRPDVLNISGEGRYRLDGLLVWVIVGGERPCSPMWGRVQAGHALQVRSRRPGDVGSTSHRKLKKLWQRCELPRHLRDWVPLVATEDGVVWSAMTPEAGHGDTFVSFLFDADNPLRRWLRARKSW